MSEFLRIFAPSANIDLKVLMGDGPATPGDGIGGWRQVERADAKNLTEWSGNSTVTQRIPILLNGWKQRNSIQGQANDIIALGRNTRGDEVPPVFRMFGPIHFPWLSWVLEDVEWKDDDDAVIRDQDTSLLRQEVILYVAEYEDPDKIRIKRIRRAFGTGKGGGTNYPGNVYVVRKDDTLGKIAAKVYGDRSRWKVLGSKNGIRDPNKKLTTGRRIKLPANPWNSNRDKKNKE